MVLDEVVLGTVAFGLAPHEQACLDSRTADPVGGTTAGECSFRIPGDTDFAGDGSDVAVIPSSLNFTFLTRYLSFGTRWLAPARTSLSGPER